MYHGELMSVEDGAENYDDTELSDALGFLDALEREKGIECDEFVEALCAVGRLLHDRNNFLDALGYFIRGRAVLETREEQLHPLMSDLLAGIGENYLLQEMYQEALPYYEKAASVREALCIAENEDTARILMKAGELQVMQGEYFAAHQHLTRAYQILCETAPDNAVLLGDACHNLGILLLSEKHFDRAFEILKKAADYRADSSGQESLERADSLVALAAAGAEIGKLSTALESLYAAVTIREQLLGEDDDLVKDAKSRYRAISEQISDSAEVKDAVIKKQPSRASSIEPNLEVLFALISTAALAVQKEQGELALKLLALSKDAISEKGLPDKLLEQIQELVGGL